jgi:hypothetical protein
MHLPYDPDEWYHHFFIEHGGLGYSIRHQVKGEDWNPDELTGGLVCLPDQETVILRA